MFKGPRYSKGEDFLATIFLVSRLMGKMLRTDGENPVAVEPHIEEPEGQPDLQRISQAASGTTQPVALICDTLRSASMSCDDPHQVEE